MKKKPDTILNRNKIYTVGVNRKEIKERVIAFNPGHIFVVYRKKYLLDINFEINDKRECYFRWSHGLGGLKISFDGEYISSSWNNPERRKRLIKRSGSMTLGEVSLWALLHEIGHAVDCKENFSRYLRENEIAKHRVYRHSLDYHDSLPFEKRADKFARQELNFWLK